jgi:hypothetical protein
MIEFHIEWTEILAFFIGMSIYQIVKWWIKQND